MPGSAARRRGRSRSLTRREPSRESESVADYERADFIVVREEEGPLVTERTFFMG